MSTPHPLSALNAEEMARARAVLLALHPAPAVIDFRAIYLLEPAKADLVPFLDAEHHGTLGPGTPRPPRLAQVKYDVIGGDDPDPDSSSKDKNHPPIHYHEAVVDVVAQRRTLHHVVDAQFHASLGLFEFERVVSCIEASPVFHAKLATLTLPDGFRLVIEPWPYGGNDTVDTDDDDGTGHDGGGAAVPSNPRLFQGLCFGLDTRSGNPDANFYAYPLPLIPVVDARSMTLLRVDMLATGNRLEEHHRDPAAPPRATHSRRVLDHARAAEYVPELLPGGTRKDLRPLTVLQPEGPSFSVDDEGLVCWQKWRFRVVFNPREGAVLHDIRYDGRSIMYRLSMSDMTVPYADPRPPFHRKQAFDFGDGFIGSYVNNLALGCDCLGVIKYFDCLLTNPDGSAQPAKNVVCLHEQDDGIGWKHTNWRTGRAVVTRRRELVVQYIMTLANYEYVFAFKLDQAAGITLEVRATGIVSVVNIDPGCAGACPWGNVVGPAALAQNHQHLFCLRVDPAVDGHRNTLVYEESLPMPCDAAANPRGNRYDVRQTTVRTSTGLDLDPARHRVFKIQNRDPRRRNGVSGRPPAYALAAPPSQLLLAADGSLQSDRARFARHHLWVTRYRDDELYAGGRYTLQSRREVGGVADAADRADRVEDEDIVLWSVFGLTHNPRVEDWPVMPSEVLQVHLKPSDFFTANPAIDVPSRRDEGSKLTEGCCR